MDTQEKVDSLWIAPRVCLMPLVQIQQVKKYFGQKQALGGLSLQLEKGEQYAVCGESGSGKSTLLYLMGGLDRPSSGEIIVNGQNLCSMNDERLALHRNRFVCFVFQFLFLLSSMNCLDNILLSGRITGMKKDTLQKKAEEMIYEFKKSFRTSQKAGPGTILHIGRL